MSIRFACPSCQTNYTVNDREAGKAAACKSCGHRMRIPGAPVEPAPPPEPLGRWEEVAEEPAPRRREPDRGRADDDWPGPPRAGRGSVLRVLAIVVWAAAGLGAVGVGSVWLTMMKGAESAVQEAAGSAMAAAVLVGGYVVARAATEIHGHVRAMQG